MTDARGRFWRRGGEERGRSGRPPQPAGPDDRALFIEHYPVVRRRCRDQADGVMVIAYELATGKLAGSRWLAASPRDLRAAIVGRHARAALSLDRSQRLSARHLAVLVEPLATAGHGRFDVRFQILDLRTGRAPRDEEGRAVAALAAEGPVFLRCAGYALHVLTTGDPTDWPERARDAWHCLPERVFVEEQLAAGSAPRSLSGAARPRHRFRTTQVNLSLGILELHGDALLLENEDPVGDLVVRCFDDQRVLRLGPSALRRGVLLGRHDRCEVGGQFITDPTVSRVHALLIEIAGSVWLVDLASSMGIAVDQHGTWKTVPHVALQPGTRVELGSEATLVTWRPT